LALFYTIEQLILAIVSLSKDSQVPRIVVDKKINLFLKYKEENHASEGR
jgi:hypothetical protein